MNKKNSLTLLLINIFVFVSIYSVKVFAEDNSKFNAKAIVYGNIKRGENIRIVIETDKIDSIYAADIYLKYDTGLLKVTSMEKGEVLSDKSIEVFDVENKYDNNKGTLRLEFSCIGKTNGFSGSGSIIVIKAEVLKDGNLIINSMPKLKVPNEIYNLKLQLIDKDVKEISFNFTSYNSKDADGSKNERDQVVNKSTYKKNSKDASVEITTENQTKTDGNQIGKEIGSNEEKDKNINKISAENVNKAPKNETDGKNKQEIYSKNKYLLCILLSITILYFAIRKNKKRLI